MKIICLEGCSGTGKTTQFHLLNKYFALLNLNHLAIIEKEYEPFKSVVRKWYETKGPNIPFTKEDVKNFANARAETFSNNFSHLENKINFILLDRYFYTSAVYQVSSGLTPKEILQINLSYGAPIPSLTFLFDCDPYICFQRIKSRNRLTGGRSLFSTTPEKISEIRKRYIELMSERSEVRIIDSSKPIEEIFQILIKSIESLF